VRENPPKRRYCRYQVNLPLTAFRFLDELLTCAIPGRCQLLSLGGVGATFADQLAIGEVLLLQLTENLKVYAAVRNMHGFRHGLEFVLLQEKQRQAMRKLCGRLAPADAPAKALGEL